MKLPDFDANKLTRIACACTLICAATLAQAQQDFPAKPVTLLIPFPPGTGNDVVGRIVGNKLAEFINQRVVADNRPGASGSIATDLVRRAPPDGYTIMIGSTSFSINFYTMKLGYTLADFTPVALIGKLPYTLMVAKGVPAKNMKDLVALLKSRPGKMNAGQGGATGTSFFLTDAFEKAAGVKVQGVPYKGTTAGVADLLADRTHLMFAPMVTSLPHYRAGKVQVQGVTGSKRSTLMPDVPTFTEQDYPMLDIPTWFGFVGPVGLPRNAVKILSDGVGKALATKEVIDALSKQGVEPGYGTAERFDAFLKADAAMWSKMVKEAGIQPK